MPLILITGYPSAGKTHRAKQLLQYLDTRIASTVSTSNSKPLRTHLITDNTVGVTHSVYNLESKSIHERSNNASEKDARAAIYAAAKRVLSDGDIVILDAAGGNYIKGWRYQLFCEAKAVRTGNCLVHVGTGIDKAREINEERLRKRDAGEEQEDGEEPYERETWENLVFRYEEPNGMTRWDSPLFTVLWDDDEPPCAAIWEACIGSEDGKKIVVRPNQATVLKPGNVEGYLYELDRATQDVLSQIAQWGKDHVGEDGGEVAISVEGKDGKKTELRVVLPTNPVGLPALQRLRRQYISMNRQNAVGATRIKESFVGYLNDCFENS